MANLYSLLKNVKDDSGQVIFLNDYDVKCIQARLLFVLDDIIETCNKYHIKYQLSGGTALGAIRHSGFIPWDDDIDINMMRPEFERFITIFQKEFGDKYWIHIPGVTKGFDFSVVHIICKDIYARGLMHADKKESGIGIDIFVIENTFDNGLLRYIQGLGSLFFRYVLSCLRIRDNLEELKIISNDNKELMEFVNKRNKLAVMLSIIPKNLWIKMNYHWSKICKNVQSRYVSIPSGQKMFFKELYVRKPFCSDMITHFEGREVAISKDYDTYLKKLYGDYMTIPPKEKQEKHVMMELDRKSLYDWYEKTVGTKTESMV